MPGTVLDSRSLNSLRRAVAGQVITPLDESYAEARRVWNAMIERYPAAVVRCARPADVAAAIGFARDQGMPLAVRGGGHSAAGYGVCDGGVVADLSLMRNVAVDPTRRSAWVDGGSTWADVDGATQIHGLAVTGGLVTHTGVGGLTLGGGLGHLMRRCGLTCDNLTGAELVTSAGEIMHVDEDENADLLWALRGGGGNFGAVTRFRFRVHETGREVLAGALMYPLEHGRELLRFYRDWAAELPDAMGTVVALRSAPAAPFVPKEIHGRPVVAIAPCWSGPVDEGEQWLAQLRTFEPPLVDAVKPKPYLEHQHIFDASAPHGRQHYKRNVNLAVLSDAAIDCIVDHAQSMTSPLAMTLIFQLGGAISRVPEGAAAYSDRHALFNVDIDAQWVDPHDPLADDHMQWVRAFHEALQPLGSGGSYVNFLMGDEGDDRLRAVYGAPKFERLAALKRRYDPDNVFRLNQNIRPA